MRLAKTYRAARRNALRKHAHLGLRALRKAYGCTRREMGKHAQTIRFVERKAWS